MDKRSTLFEERNHFKALYEHEKAISAVEIKRLEEENRAQREIMSEARRLLDWPIPIFQETVKKMLDEV